MININGKFKIDADENQFILKEVGTVQDKESRTIKASADLSLIKYITFFI